MIVIVVVGRRHLRSQNDQLMFMCKTYVQKTAKSFIRIGAHKTKRP